MSEKVKAKANSRQKGAEFERHVAGRLLGLTGVTFKRDLEQYRSTDHGDLIPDDPAFPFVVECKRYASGRGCKAAWREQATKAAKAVGKMPAVIYRYDRADIAVSVPVSAVTAAVGGKAGQTDEWADITIEGFAYLCGELMAGAA